MYIITRRDIEKGSMDRLLAFLGPEVPKNEIRSLRGNVVFTVSGFDETDEELYAIQDVRNYISLLTKCWGGWFYFCDLNTSFLRLVACAVVDNLMAAITTGSSYHQDILLNKKELFAWGDHCLAVMAMIDAGLKIPKEDGMERMRVITRYFGFK